MYGCSYPIFWMNQGNSVFYAPLVSLTSVLLDLSARGRHCTSVKVRFKKFCNNRDFLVIRCNFRRGVTSPKLSCFTPGKEIKRREVNNLLDINLHTLKPKNVPSKFLLTTGCGCQDNCTSPSDRQATLPHLPPPFSGKRFRFFFQCFCQRGKYNI